MARNTKRRKSNIDRPNRAKAVRNLSKEGKRKQSNRVMFIAIAAVVSVFIAIMVINIVPLFSTWKKEKDTEAQLKEQYKKELQISKELKEKKKFIQTDEFIEDKARKLGLLYPDEVILQPENK